MLALPGQKPHLLLEAIPGSSLVADLVIILLLGNGNQGAETYKFYQ